MSLNIEIGCHLTLVFIVLIIFSYVLYAIRKIITCIISYKKEENRKKEIDESYKIANSRLEKQQELDKIKLENSKSEKLEYNQLKKQLGLIEEKLNNLSCTNSK